MLRGRLETASIMDGATEQHVRRTPRYLIIGILTVAPLWVTWLVFNFVFAQLSRLGSPWVATLARMLRRDWPNVADFLLLPWFQSTMAALLSLCVLYLIGRIASNVIGQRLLNWFDRLVQSIPMVAAIYGGTKRFLTAMKEQPAGVQRVVLINFPSSEMKALGLVTKVMTDRDTGESVAAVYVPTAPNPTSGYIEIVPVGDLVETDWTLDEAMSFVMTGGTASPDQIRFHNDPAALDRAREQA